MKEEKWIQAMDRIKMDDSMKQRLDDNCMRKKCRQHRKFRWYKPVVIATWGVGLLVSVPIIAHVTATALERMEVMDKDEVESLNDMIQEQKVDASSFSRELTEDEQNRKKALEEEYTHKGRFPEGEIKCVDGERLISGEGLYYETKNSKYYFPDRVLTNEELLQIIDFNHKINYSLHVMNRVEMPKVNMEDINNMRLMEKAEYIIGNIYGNDTKNLERTVEWYNEETDAYEITFTEGSREYYIRMEKETLKVEKVSANLETNLQSCQVVTKEVAENETVLFEEAKDIIENIFNINQPIKSARCNYYIGDGNRGQDRNLNYLFELEDGSAYIFNYVYEEGTYKEGILRSFEYIGSFEWYHTLLKNNEPNNAKKGIKRVEFEIDL